MGLYGLAGKCGYWGITNLVVLFVWLTLISSCRSQDEGVGLHRQIAFREGTTDKPFQPLEPALAKQLASYSAIERLSDLFEIERCLKLDTEEAMVGLVSDIEGIDGHWFLLDLQGSVYHYSPQGEYLGLVGGKGEGPGEHLQARSIARWGKRLVVADTFTSKYLVYDLNGRHLRTYDTRDGAIVTRNLIPSGDRFYLMEFNSWTIEVPYHVALDVSSENWRVLWGFGRRFHLAVSARQRRDIPNMGMTSYALVGDRIWSGSPYITNLEVFDLEGRFVAELATGVEGLKPEDYQGVKTAAEFETLRREKYYNLALWYLDPLVIAHFGRYPRGYAATVYDREGHILTANLPVGHGFFSPVAHNVGDRIAAAIFAGDLDPEKLKRDLGNRALTAILEAGYDPDSDEEALFLIISGLKRTGLDQKISQ